MTITTPAEGWPSFKPRSLGPLIRKELRESIRNKWFLLYGVAFAAMAVALSYVTQLGTGMAGMAGFGKTAASLVNLTLLIVPLMGITMGALSLSNERERGMLAYVLAQPVHRSEVYLAKFIGQGLAFGGAISLGFGISAAVLAHNGVSDGQLFLRIAGLSVLLALSMLAIGMLIATVVRRSSAALGASIVVWLFITLIGDLGLMGAATLFDLEVSQLLTLSFLNPTQVFKFASIAGFDATLDIFGPAGIYAVRTLGPWLMTALIGALVLWITAPFLIGLALFTRRPL